MWKKWFSFWKVCRVMKGSFFPILITHVIKNRLNDQTRVYSRLPEIWHRIERRLTERACFHRRQIERVHITFIRQFLTVTSFNFRVSAKQCKLTSAFPWLLFPHSQRYLLHATWGAGANFDAVFPCWPGEAVIVLLAQRPSQPKPAQQNTPKQPPPRKRDNTKVQKIVKKNK